MKRLLGICLLAGCFVSFADESGRISPDEADAAPITTPVMSSSEEPIVTSSSEEPVLTVTDEPAVASEDESNAVAGADTSTEESVVAVPVPAAIKHFYVRGDIGVTTLASTIRSSTPLLNDSKFRSTIVYSLGAGYKYSDFLRTDINFQYRRFGYKKSDSIENMREVTNSYVIFWNGYLDAKNHTIFTPYLTGGIGYSRLSPGDAKGNDKYNSDIFKGRINNNFAWNGGAGSRVKISDGFDLDLAYRYVRLGRINFENSNMGTSAGKPFLLKTHEVTLGLAYNF